ncbi:Uncharacterized protein conserved in bacteria [Urinicoccus massiliensis]|uniref:Uncharacterized protein conserved in bacteria n=1 Tax=Urinicoccus massiliensis TaxID=1723382 RepID=A0A8H2QSI7_9FIRM|nr:Veg family protein [Urinicoccus massiliensis]VFB16946.1 Uncharacterized protein conserved in bacteria [Urinicoccus massiliensis]
MNQMEQIRKELTRHIGKRVILKADKGRKKIVTRRGRLVEVYPSLFVVDIEHEVSEGKRTISYTFSDVLTSTVRLTIIDDDGAGENKKIS